MTQTLYLNNSGSRWINLTKGQRDRVRVYLDGKDVGTRSVDFYEAFGNFATWHVRVKGQRYRGLPRDFERDENGLPILDLESPPIREAILTANSRYRLKLWRTGKRDDLGKEILRYRFERIPARVPYTLFEGADFHASPLHAADSDETIRALLGFLTLKPGDTDSEYFDSYTPDQMTFATSPDAEYLAAYADEDGPGFEED